MSDRNSSSSNNRSSSSSSSGINFNPFSPEGLLTAPFVVGKAGFDIALMTTVSLARMAQIALQSADTALARYIELTEQEIKRSQRRESIKVE